jgi:hypothetical protein
MMQPSCPGLSLVTRAGFTVMTLKQSSNSIIINCSYDL